MLRHEFFSSLLLRLLLQERNRRDHLEALQLQIQQLDRVLHVVNGQAAHDVLRHIDGLVSQAVDAIYGVDSAQQRQGELKTWAAEAQQLWEREFGSLDNPEVAAAIDRTAAALYARGKR